jgi:WD40 repeat protein
MIRTIFLCGMVACMSRLLLAVEVEFNEMELQGSPVAVSPDGKFVAVGGQGGTPKIGAELWDLEKNVLAHQLKTDVDYLCRCLTFSPDSSLVAAILSPVAGGKTSLFIWEVNTGKVQSAVPQNFPDAEIVWGDTGIFVTNGTGVSVLNPKFGESRFELAVEDTAFRKIAYVPKTNQLFAFTEITPVKENSGVYVFDMNTKKVFSKAIFPELKDVHQMIVSADGERFALLPNGMRDGSMTGLISVRNIGNGGKAFTWEVREGHKVTAIQFVPGTTHFTVSSVNAENQKYVAVIDTNTRRPVVDFPQATPADSIAWAMDRKTLATSAVESNSVVYQLPTAIALPPGSEDLAAQPAVPAVPTDSDNAIDSPEVPQDPEPTPQAVYRTWTSSDGKFKIEAKFLRGGIGKIVLETKEGSRQITVPTSKLSQPDLDFLKSLR